MLHTFVIMTDWKHHVEGQKLEQDSANFRSKLDARRIFEEWSQRVIQRNISVNGNIFAVENTRQVRMVMGKDGSEHAVKIARLRVNFQVSCNTFFLVYFIS